jgi:hypothetical protein
MTIQLFRVSSLVPEFREHQGVVLNWFVADRKEPLALPYADLIENYDDGSDHFYPKGALDEMFTEAEATALVGYLKTIYGDEPSIRKQSLPIPSNLMGDGAIAVGGAQDFLMISESDVYSLPFKVWGYYDLSHAASGPWVDAYRPSPEDVLRSQNNPDEIPCRRLA